jgi:hypothetical protein
MAGDMHGLSENILRVIADPQLREKVKYNAVEKIKLEMNNAIQAQKVLEVYREVLE